MVIVVFKKNGKNDFFPMQIDLMLLMIVVPPLPPDPSSKGVTTSFESIYKCCWQKWWVFHSINAFSQNF